MSSGPGCGQCSDADPAVAEERRGSLGFVARIADESHFFVTLRRCRSCGQDYASIFCETIDWQDSDDPQYTLLIPLTAAEARSLSEAGEDGVEAALGNLSPRRYLFNARGKGEKDWSRYWARGPISVPRHD
jgi:hypothetical protein